MPESLAFHAFRSPRHVTRYWEAGPVDGRLMIFLHGWPGIGLLWRSQIEAFASEGWRCIAPDMRGYGGSSAPAYSMANALSEIVEDISILPSPNTFNLRLETQLSMSSTLGIGHSSTRLLPSPSSCLGAIKEHS